MGLKMRCYNVQITKKRVDHVINQTRQRFNTIQRKIFGSLPVLSYRNYCVVTVQ